MALRDLNKLWARPTGHPCLLHGRNVHLKSQYLMELKHFIKTTISQLFIKHQNQSIRWWQVILSSQLAVVSLMFSETLKIVFLTVFLAPFIQETGQNLLWQIPPTLLQAGNIWYLGNNPLSGLSDHIYFNPIFVYTKERTSKLSPWLRCQQGNQCPRVA